MPNIDWLKNSPAVIERILAQGPDRQHLLATAPVLMFDENSDGTLSSGETTKRVSGSPGQPLKSISVIKTPAQGLKCPRGTNPRPQCQWPYGVVIVDNRPDGVGAVAAPYATMDISPADLANKIATWTNQTWKDEPDTPSLQLNYYTPLSPPTEYNDKHRCTVFRRKAEPEIYMVLIHKPMGNNSGKALKKPKKRTHEDAEDDAAACFASFAKLAKHSNDPARKWTAEQKAKYDDAVASMAALESSLAAGGSAAGPAAPAGPASEPEQDTTMTYRGGGGEPAPRAVITAECFAMELAEAMEEEEFVSEELSAAIDAARLQLAELEEDLTASKVLVCISKQTADGERSLAGAEEVEVIRDVFGYRHVDVVSATSADLGAALMGDRKYNIVHFIGHGHAGSQFCLW
jgi:hypothetical protein